MIGSEYNSLQEVIRLTLPAMFGHVPIGISFGLQMTH